MIRKPQAPRKPLVPAKTFTEEPLLYSHCDSEIEIYVNKIKGEIYCISAWADYDGYIEISIFGKSIERENPNYEKEYKKYEKELVKYEKKYGEYKEKLKQWKKQQTERKLKAEKDLEKKERAEFERLKEKFGT